MRTLAIVIGLMAASASAHAELRTEVVCSEGNGSIDYSLSIASGPVAWLGDAKLFEGRFGKDRPVAKWAVYRPHFPDGAPEGETIRYHSPDGNFSLTLGELRQIDSDTIEAKGKLEAQYEWKTSTVFGPGEPQELILQKNVSREMPCTIYRNE